MPLWTPAKTKQGSGETIQYKIVGFAKHKVPTSPSTAIKLSGDSQLLPHGQVKKSKLFSRGLYSEKLIRSSVKNLEATYHAEGFSAVKVTPKVEGKGGDIDVTFVVNEGPRDMVRELQVVGNDTMPLAQLVPKGLKARRRASPTRKAKPMTIAATSP